MSLTAAIEELHGRCAIYTSASAANELLDLVGWTAPSNLSKSVLLEPCVGEGAILLEAARRLLASFRARNKHLNRSALQPRIKGFELHPGTARVAKKNLRRLLLEEGLAWTTASALSDAWITERDFLLEKPRYATHVVANPPYVRWVKLPEQLATIYRTALPTIATRGDVAVAFLYRMQQWAEEDGVIGALVSDRWMFAQYGSEFLENSRAHGWSIDVADERPQNPFVQQVGAYSAIVRISRRATAIEGTPVSSRATARKHHAKLLAKYGSLGDAGCLVRVGPALGAGQTFVLNHEQIVDVEPDLIHPFVNKDDLGGTETTSPRQRVVIPYDTSGKLICLEEWPGFRKWVSGHEAALRKRSHFAGTDQYWRTIDAVPEIWWGGPKLLVPELCREPIVTLDRSGCIPAHSIYAIWPGEWPVETLQRVLNSGLLHLTAIAEAPKLKHGWVRFYKRFLMRTPLPKWTSLSPDSRSNLANEDESAFQEMFEQMFGFKPGAPPVK